MEKENELREWESKRSERGENPEKRERWKGKRKEREFRWVERDTLKVRGKCAKCKCVRERRGVSEREKERKCERRQGKSEGKSERVKPEQKGWVSMDTHRSKLNSLTHSHTHIHLFKHACAYTHARLLPYTHDTHKAC